MNTTRLAILALLLAGCGGGGYEKPFSPAREDKPYAPPFAVEVVRVLGMPVAWRLVDGPVR